MRNVQNFLPIAILGAAGYLAYKLFGKSNQAQHSADTVKTVKEEIQQKENTGQRASYSDAQYKAWGDILYDAMFDAGTDEDSIYRVMDNMRNDVDVLKLVLLFGVRPYYTFGWRQGDYNLGQWFRQELSDGETQKVNQILKSKNIAYRF